MIPPVEERKVRLCDRCIFFYVLNDVDDPLEYCSIKDKYTIERPKTDKCLYNFTTAEIKELIDFGVIP